MVSLFKKKNKISKSSNNGSSPLQLNRKSSLNDLNNHNTNNTDNTDNNTNQIGHKSSYSSGSSSNSTKFSSNIPITPRLPNSLPTPGTSLSTPNHDNIMNTMTNNNNDEYSPMIVNNIVSSNPTTPNFVPSFVTNLKDSGASTKFTNININNNDNINNNNNSKDHSHHSQRQHQQPSQMNQGHQRKVSVASYYTTPPQTSDSQDQQKQHPLPKQIRSDSTNNDQYQQQPIQQQYYQSSTNNIPPPINNNSKPSINNNPDQIPIYSPVTVTSQNNINNNMNSLASTPTKSQTPLQIPQQQRQQSSSNQLSKQKSQQFEQYHKEQLQNSPQQRLFVNTPWKKKKLYNSPFPRFSHAASASTSESGAFYLMGGLCGKHVYGDMWIIEPVKNDKTLPSDDYSYIASPIENFDRVPAPRIGHSAVLIGNAFIVFAGDTVTNASQILDNKLYFFNITSLKWTITSPEGARPIGRYGHKISVLNFEAPIPQDELDESDNNNSTTRWSSYLYVFGGQLEDELFNDIWKFDLSNFRNPKTHWQKIQIDESFSYVPPKLTNHSMIAYDDKLYIYGGTDGREISDKLICFDASNEIFIDCKLKGDFKPPALEEHTCTLYQNLMFVYGGRDSLNNSTDILFCIDLNTFECFKVLSGLFNSPGKRCGHSITVDLLNEKLIVMGGDQQDNDLTNVSEMTNVTIDVSNLNYPTTVIYEFDLNLLTKYMDRSNNVNKQQQLQRQIYQEDNNNELSSPVTPNKTEANVNNATDQLKLPSTISDPAVAATSDVTSPLKHMSSLRRGKGKEDDEIDDDEEEDEDDFGQEVGVKSKGHVVSKSINDQDSQYYKSGIAPKRISQYAVFENISDDDVARINDEQPLTSSTPLKKVDPAEIEDEEEVEAEVEVPNKITSKLSNATRHPIKSAGPLNSDLINDNDNNDNDNDNTNASHEIYKNIDYNNQSSPIDSDIAGINSTLDNTYNENTMDSHLRNKDKNKMNSKPLSAIMSINYDNNNNTNNKNNGTNNKNNGSIRETYRESYEKHKGNNKDSIISKNTSLSSSKTTSSSKNDDFSSDEVHYEEIKAKIQHTHHGSRTEDFDDGEHYNNDIINDNINPDSKFDGDLNSKSDFGTGKRNSVIMIDSKSSSSNTVKNPMFDTDTESISNGLSPRPLLKGVPSTGGSSNKETRNSGTSPLFADEDKTNLKNHTTSNDITTDSTAGLGAATGNAMRTAALGAAIGAATGTATGAISSMVSRSLNSAPVNGSTNNTSKINTNPMNVNGLSIAPPKGNHFRDDMLTPLEQIQNIDMMPPPKAPRTSSNRDSIDTEASPPLLPNPRVSSSNPLYVMSNDTNDGDSQKLIQTNSNIPETPIKKYSRIENGNTHDRTNEKFYKEPGNDNNYNTTNKSARISTSGYEIPRKLNSDHQNALGSPIKTSSDTLYDTEFPNAHFLTSAPASAVTTANSTNTLKSAISNDYNRSPTVETGSNANNTLDSFKLKKDYDKELKMMAEMLTKLRTAMNEKVLQANDRIIELENSKVHTAEKVKELEKELESKNLEILELKSKNDETYKSLSAINGAQSENIDLHSKEISETPVSFISSDKYSVLNEALKDEALRLDSENEILRQQNNEFKKYMDDQVFQLTNFNNLIKEQQSTISKLESKILQANQDSVEWQKKYMDLQSEVTSFKIVYGIDEETGLLDADLDQETGDDVNIGNETPEEIPNAELVYPKNSDKNGGNNKRVLSKSRNVSTNGIYSNVKALTSDVDKLLTMWKNSSSRNLNGTDDHIDGNNSRDLSDLSASSVGTSIAPSGSRLQSQLDKILELTKKDDLHEQELKALRAKYEASEKEYLDKLTEMEISYKQSVQSLNNTHRALTLSQNELDKQRDINKKLTSELDELRLISSKKSMPGSRNITPILGRGHTPLSADKESFDDSINNEDQADDEDMGLDARYRFKIRDLEADLVIVGQERDQLRDELIKLKKKVMMTN